MVLIRVPPGWTASSEGYFLNAAALSDLSAAAKTYRLERDAWASAYRELVGNTEQLEARMKSQLAALGGEIEAERKTWGRRIRAARAPGVGVFAGAGYTPSGFEPVIGVGVVWRVW